MTQIRYPSGVVTPHGRHAIRKGDMPMVSLVAPNQQIVFWLMGGHAIADPTAPESVQVKGIKGLLAPWEVIDQQGATEDGTTFVDALYGPTEVNLDTVAIARDAKHLRQLVRHLYECLDVKNPSELGWMTHELGYWWAPVRWLRPPPDPMIGGQRRNQPLQLALRADSGFWQSYPDVAEFGATYEDVTDSFNTADYTDDENLGPNWPQYYEGTGGGYCYSNGEHARWKDDPYLLTASRTVVNGPLKDFATTTNHQVVSTVLGSYPEFSLPDTGANDLWARMSRDESGDWAGDGIRLRVTRNRVHLSAFVDFDEVWTRTITNLFTPFPGDKWTLVAGYSDYWVDNPRLFKVQRNGATVLEYVEPATGGSLYGEDYRGVGFGMRAGSALVTQATPAIMRKISAGDNLEASQNGFIERRNAGDQPAYDEITVYGPGTFGIANGPDSTDMVELGPLEPGEIALIRTDPRNRGVFDLTPRTGDETAPILFGANPTDTMYRKLTGRFTSDYQIPAKEPGMRVGAHKIAVSITGGNPDSKIMASLTPLRRSPQ